MGQSYFLMFIIILAAFAYGCTQNNVELKAKEVKQELNQIFQVKAPLQVGDEPYNFTVVTTEGKAIRLSDFIEDKKPVIVYFFATW